MLPSSATGAIRLPVIADKTVDVFDTLTGEALRVPFDRVVLSMPLVPPEDTKTLAALLGLPQDEGGFLAEPRMRLRPGRYADPGIYVLGSVHQPADTAEALVPGLSDAEPRAARFLKQESITLSHSDRLRRCLAVHRLRQLPAGLPDACDPHDQA